MVDDTGLAARPGTEIGAQRSLTYQVGSGMARSSCRLFLAVAVGIGSTIVAAAANPQDESALSGRATRELLVAHDAMRDIAAQGTHILTLGQYLQPDGEHLPIERYVHPDEFAEYKRLGEEMGLKHVEAGPLVRSSYHAFEQEAAARS